MYISITWVYIQHPWLSFSLCCWLCFSFYNILHLFSASLFTNRLDRRAARPELTSLRLQITFCIFMCVYLQSTSYIFTHLSCALLLLSFIWKREKSDVDSTLWKPRSPFLISCVSLISWDYVGWFKRLYINNISRSISVHHIFKKD